jgi:hypothetical protein
MRLTRQFRVSTGLFHTGMIMSIAGLIIKVSGV